MPQNHILASNLDTKTFDALSNAHTDITNPVYVEVSADKEKGIVYVNVNGVCVFRACQIQTLTVENR